MAGTDGVLHASSTWKCLCCDKDDPTSRSLVQMKGRLLCSHRAIVDKQHPDEHRRNKWVRIVLCAWCVIHIVYCKCVCVCVWCQCFATSRPRVPPWCLPLLNVRPLDTGRRQEDARHFALFMWLEWILYMKRVVVFFFIHSSSSVVLYYPILNIHTHTHTYTYIRYRCPCICICGGFTFNMPQTPPEVGEIIQSARPY